MTDTVEARDGCVVDTGPLAELLSHFVAGFQAPQFSGAGARRSTSTAQSVGAARWLSEATARRGSSVVPAETIQNIIRRGPDGRPAPRYKTTELRVADALVMAINRPLAFHDGTLRVRPNPRAPRALRAQCCTGAIRGAMPGTRLPSAMTRGRARF